MRGAVQAARKEKVFRPQADEVAHRVRMRRGQGDIEGHGALQRMSINVIYLPLNRLPVRFEARSRRLDEPQFVRLAGSGTYPLRMGTTEALSVQEFQFAGCQVSERFSSHCGCTGSGWRMAARAD